MGKNEQTQTIEKTSDYNESYESVMKKSSKEYIIQSIQMESMVVSEAVSDQPIDITVEDQKDGEVSGASKDYETTTIKEQSTTVGKTQLTTD